MKVQDLPVGAQVSLGEYFDATNGDVSELVWVKASMQNHFITAQSIGRLQGDYREHESLSRDHRRHGNNYYPHSNLHQWLNSTQKDWFEPAHPADTVGTFVRKQPGFLSYFAPGELNCIQPMHIGGDTPPGSIKRHGKTYELDCLVTIPTLNQILGHHHNLEGEHFELFLYGFWEGMRHYGYEVREVLTRSPSTADGCNWWVVPPGASLSSRFVRNVDEFTSVYPLIQLKEDLEVFGRFQPHYLITSDCGWNAFRETLFSSILA